MVESGGRARISETAIAVNPTDRRNLIGGANDYEPGVDSVMGIYASFDGGKKWPYAGTRDRSSHPPGSCSGQVTRWSRSTVQVSRAPRSSLSAVTTATLIVPLVPGTDLGNVSPDRLYVTWIRFDFGPTGTSFVEAPIHLAYSDDEGRHWSAPKEISGSSAQFCQTHGDMDAPACDEDQFSVPVVDPRTGRLYVAFENFNTPGTINQYLVVRSDDSGQTFSGPFRAADVVDGPGTYPICADDQTLTDMCARVNAAGNIDLDARTGTLYLTWADNRNGTAANTNTDVFVARSTDGGQTWSPARQVTTNPEDQFSPWLWRRELVAEEGHRVLLEPRPGVQARAVHRRLQRPGHLGEHGTAVLDRRAVRRTRCPGQQPAAPAVRRDGRRRTAAALAVAAAPTRRRGSAEPRRGVACARRETRTTRPAPGRHCCAGAPGQRRTRPGGPRPASRPPSAAPMC